MDARRVEDLRAVADDHLHEALDAFETAQSKLDAIERTVQSAKGDPEALAAGLACLGASEPREAWLAAANKLNAKEQENKELRERVAELTEALRNILLVGQFVRDDRDRNDIMALARAVLVDSEEG